MNGVILVILAMAFAAIVLTGQAIWFYIRGRREEEEGRIQRRLGVDQMSEEEALASLLRESAADSALERMGDYGRTLQLTLQQAGLDWTVSALMSYMLLTFGIVFVGGMATIGPKAILFALPATYLPLGWVRSRATSRAKALLSQLPDALEMMGRAMQTGAGLIDCFRLVQDEMNEPVATEFGRVSDEVRFGKDWRLALEELISRNPTLFDLRLFVSSVLLQRETGGNMIDTFERISKLIRMRYAFDAKVKAMTSEARASGFVLAVMPIGVLALVMVANPQYLEPLWTTALGQMVVIYAVVSYGLGLFIMSAASKVEV